MPKDSQLGFFNRFRANREAKQEYKQEKRASRQFRKANKDTFKSQAKQMNADIKEINKIIRKQGYYNGLNGEHYEKPIKKINYQQLMNQDERIMVKPKKPIKRLPLLVKLSLALQKIKEKILNFFVNLSNRQTVYSEPSFTPKSSPNPVAGLGNKHDNGKEVSVDKNVPEMQMGNELQVFQQENRTNIDINKEFQHWLTENKINRTAPSEIVFDFIKSATMEGFIANEKGVSELLSYALENTCEYSAENDTVTMFFATKEPQGIAAFSVDSNGEISCPETFMYKGEEFSNVVTDETVSKIPPKIQLISDNLKATPALLYNLVNEMQYSQTGLDQVREYIDKTGLSQYLPHIDAVENTINDQNAIKALNEFIVKSSFIESLSPNEVVDLAFIKPALAMSQMMNPGQYKEIFPFVENNLIKGHFLDTSFKLGELLMTKTDEGKILQTAENREKIISHIEGLEKAGFTTNDIIDIVSLYNTQRDPEILALSIGTINYELANGTPIEDLGVISKMQEINPEEIAMKITNEMAYFTPEDLKGDIENETLKTMTGVYIHTLSDKTLNEVANNLHESVKDVFERVAGLQVDIGDVVLNEEAQSTVTIDDTDTQSIDENDKVEEALSATYADTIEEDLSM